MVDLSFSLVKVVLGRDLVQVFACFSAKIRRYYNLVRIAAFYFVIVKLNTFVDLAKRDIDFAKQEVFGIDRV